MTRLNDSSKHTYEEFHAEEEKALKKHLEVLSGYNYLPLVKQVLSKTYQYATKEEYARYSRKYTFSMMSYVKDSVVDCFQTQEFKDLLLEGLFEEVDLIVSTVKDYLGLMNRKISPKFEGNTVEEQLLDVACKTEFGDYIIKELLQGATVIDFERFKKLVISALETVDHRGTVLVVG